MGKFLTCISTQQRDQDEVTDELKPVSKPNLKKPLVADSTESPKTLVIPECKPTTLTTTDTNLQQITSNNEFEHKLLDSKQMRQKPGASETAYFDHSRAPCKRNYYLIFRFLNEVYVQQNCCINIPQQIYFICLAYFEIDYFAQCGPMMTIKTTGSSACSGATTMVKYTEHNRSWNTCFGKLRIASMSDTIHRWSFIVMTSSSEGNMCIGIDGSDVTNCTRNHYSPYLTHKTYCLMCTGGRLSANSKRNCKVEFLQNKDGNHGAFFTSGDLVLMELDLVNRTLCYTIGNELSMRRDKFENIQKKKGLFYRMAVSTLFTADCIALVEYTTNKYDKFTHKTYEKLHKKYDVSE